MNRWRDRKWNAMTEEVLSFQMGRALWLMCYGQEQADYLQTTKDEGNARLDFRFAY